MTSDPKRGVLSRALKTMHSGIVFAALLAFASCAAPPPPPPPTVANVKAIAAPDVNGVAGVGAPIAIRVYQLGAKAGFEGAEFFPLFSADAATLKADLLKKEEFVLAPGATKSLTLTPNDQVKAIGVFAAYRDFQNTVWRAVADIPPNKTTNITITADGKGLKLVAAPAAP